ncbi:MAG: ABC transporter permease subunit [Haloarculaceae archaeon]
MTDAEGGGPSETAVERGETSTSDPRRLLVIANRELWTLLRSRLVLALAVGFVAVVAALGWLGNAGGGYLPLTLTLLTPLEALVPLLGFALGYRAILDERARGELAVLRTYPVDRRTYVGGLFLGRAVALVTVVLLALAVAGLQVAFFQQQGTTVLATHATVDSPVLYLRFVALTAGYALVTLALALAVSALATTSRGALALAALAFVGFVLGLDASLVVGLGAGLLSESTLTAATALSPPSAYRALVVAVSVTPVAPGFAETPPAWLASLGLVGWGAGLLGVAGVAVWR